MLRLDVHDDSGVEIIIPHTKFSEVEWLMKYLLFVPAVLIGYGVARFIDWYGSVRLYGFYVESDPIGIFPALLVLSSVICLVVICSVYCLVRRRRVGELLKLLIVNGFGLIAFLGTSLLVMLSIVF